MKTDRAGAAALNTRRRQRTRSRRSRPWPACRATSPGHARAARRKPSTIQTYLSFLRGLGNWLGKPGFIRPPAYYGLELAEYQRSGIGERDKSWSAQGADVDGLIDKVAAFDPHVGSMLRLIRAFGLCKREAIMFRANECVVSRLAGHNRGRASAAYLGAVLHKRKGGTKGGAGGGAADGDAAA